MFSTFADRLWWARQRSKMGATTLARKIGFAQPLLSQLERNDSPGSKYNKQFAAVLKVDPHWLATGEGKAPEGFDPELARQGRQEMIRNGSRQRGSSIGRAIRAGASVVEMEPRARWAEVPPGDASPKDANALQKSLVSDFMDYSRIVGPERTKAFIETLAHLSGVVHQVAKGKDKVRAG